MLKFCQHLGVTMPLRFRTAHGMLSCISTTTTIFGTPVADTFTGEVLRKVLSPA